MVGDFFGTSVFKFQPEQSKNGDQWKRCDETPHTIIPPCDFRYDDNEGRRD